MNTLIDQLQPRALWSIFSELCAIPRPSKNEEKVVEYVKNFGESLQLVTLVDEAGNIIIKKPATPGMENRKGMVLQSHLDMVPQKNSDKKHDFLKDPIEAYIDGDWVTANGTTLGADNGIGVASILAILKADDIVHGPLEALLTIDEETGMTGAFALKPGQLDGQILINLDSEEEGELYVGCAGGIESNIRFSLDEQPAPKGSIAYELSVRGMKGGHSGLDINLGRGNSIKVLNRILWSSLNKYGVSLAHGEGGSLRNAIPREADAVITVPENNKKAFETFIQNITLTITNELQATEPDLQIKLEETDMPEKIIENEQAKKLIGALYACPNGVIRMSDAVPGLVETSTNLAVFRAGKGSATLQCLLRSSVDTAKHELAGRMAAVFELAGGEVEFTGEYPGWKPNKDSVILSICRLVYEQKFGKKPDVKAIHAGLECGIIGGIYPGLDMISFGPTIQYPHSPDEKVNIASVLKFWNFLLETLKNIPGV